MVHLATLPQFVLRTRCRESLDAAGDVLGHWAFLIREIGGDSRFQASDCAGHVRGGRLHLWALVRALEAFDQPSHVVLANPSQYVRRGLQYGLDQWKRTNWRWERFGQLELVRNADLWQRVDTALAYHQLECRTVRIDSAHGLPRRPHFDLQAKRSQGRRAMAEVA